MRQLTLAMNVIAITVRCVTDGCSSRICKAARPAVLPAFSCRVLLMFVVMPG